MTPAETDKGLQASVQQRCGLRLDVHLRMEFPAEGGLRPVVSGTSLEPLRDDVDPAEALRMVELAMQSAPAGKLAEALTRLRALCLPRNQGSADQELEAAAYLDALAEFPADVALETLREWPRRRNGRFWPSWAELLPILEAKAAPRRAMADRLRREMSRDCR